MKKIMILLLSLAVLFSFAACDNSSDTPAQDTEIGASALINQSVLRNLADDIVSLMTDSTTNNTAISSLVGAAQDYKNVTNNESTYQVTKSLEDGNELLDEAATSVTLALNGVNPTKEGDTVTKYTLSTFSYSFSENIIAADGNNAVASGTINGYIADMTGTMTITKVDGGDNTVVVTPGTAVILKDASSLTDVKFTRGDVVEEATSEQVEYLYQTLVTKTWSPVEVYKSYNDDAREEQVDAVESFVTALVGTNSDSVIKTVVEYVSTTDVKKSVTMAEDGLSVTITISNGTPADDSQDGSITLAGSSAGKQINLPSNTTLTLVLSGTKNATSGFDVTGFTVSAGKELLVLDSGDAYEDFDSIKINTLKGSVEGTWNVVSADSLGTVAGTYTVTEANVTAVAPVGPELNAAGNGIATETVLYEVKPATV